MFAAGPAVRLMGFESVVLEYPEAEKKSVRLPVTPLIANPVNVALPVASVVAVAGLKLAAEPVLTFTVTTTPARATGFPRLSTSCTTGTGLIVTPLCALAGGCVTMVILFATPAAPVALKVTGLPVRPVEVAVMVLVPTTLPSVQLVSDAIPLALVLTVAGLDGLELPPPAVTVKTTATP